MATPAPKIVPKPGFISWGPGDVPPPPEIDDESHDNEELSAISRAGREGVSAFLARMRDETIQEEGGKGVVKAGNGRTYHGKYPLPNDHQERERLNFQHKALQIAFGGHLHFAPISSNPQHVLDIGTGTGIWAIDFAKEHPETKVLGTDLSAMHPPDVPTNCHFEVADAEEEWKFPDQFDLVHGRALMSCFKDPRVVLRHAFGALKPGGWLEMQDGFFPLQFAGDTPVGSALYKWSEIVVSGAAKSGRPWTNLQHYKRWMEEIGFEDVVELDFYTPTGPWAKGEYYKLIGCYFNANLRFGFPAASWKVMGALGWSLEDSKLFLDKAMKELEENSAHAYIPVKVVFGRKPLHVS